MTRPAQFVDLERRPGYEALGLPEELDLDNHDHVAALVSATRSALARRAWTPETDTSLGIRVRIDTGTTEHMYCGSSIALIAATILGDLLLSASGVDPWADDEPDTTPDPPPPEDWRPL